MGLATALLGLAATQTGGAKVAKVAPAPTAIDVTSGTEALDAQKAAKKKALLAQGFSSQTSAGALTDTATTKKALLG